ncbi:helix-turn-helix domain-containing protein [Marinobacter halodurans]|uniref:Helix-turn-helix domain-containing protein n=1 Tax=Marinobacter halodurans TaxID=2528979 RepID=A0ABY1ZP19_9GAMM|nr:helix-turn-helix domain-containing protein [Marinobacter halodurans]TBW58163.1 helix-turn-helix domain-containing protein [Marinobacter halodurans]
MGVGKETGCAAYYERQTEDVVEHARAPDGWILNYEQVSAGKFSGLIRQVDLPRFQIIEDRANQAMVKSGTALEGSVCFSLPAKGSSPQLICLGNSYDKPGLLVADSRSLPEVRTVSYLRIFNLNVQKHLLVDYVAKQGLTLDTERSTYFFPFQRPLEQQELTQAITNVLMLSKQGRLEQKVFRKNAQDLILSHVLDVCDDTECLRHVSSTRKKQMVDRARTYVLEHSEEPLSIMDLCNHVGASRRKLQYCFQDVLGISPVSFLRIMRLNAVHRILCRVSDEKQIQDVAADWGFWHLGHFTADYRNLFGERPSDTRRRAIGKLPISDNAF